MAYSLRRKIACSGQTSSHIPQKMQRIMSISNSSGYFSTLANRSVEGISPGIILIARGAQLTGNAAHTPVRIPHKRGRAPIMVRQAAVPFFLGILHRNLGAPEQHICEMLQGNDEAADD